MNSDSFERNLAISGSAHLVLAALIFFKAVFFPGEPIDLRSAIRVDIVGLPDKLPEMKELPTAAPPAKTETTPPAEVVKADPVKLPPKVEPKPTAPSVPVKAKPKDTTRAQREAMNRLKTMQALDKIKNEVGDAKKPGVQLKGTEVSAGNSLSGIARLDFNRYTDDLRKRVNDNWKIDEYLREGSYRVQIQILIDENGVITKRIFRKTSGNEAFDSTVVEAVEASSPLPAPPAELRAVLATSGVVLNFPEQ